MDRVTARDAGTIAIIFPRLTMDTYHIALFLHILTLIVAAGATAVTKLAAARRIRAGAAREALEWHELLMSTSKLFPLCLAAFVITGAYMTRIAGVWSSGFVISGLVGVTLLLASGTYLSVKANGLKPLLQNAANQSPDAPAPRLAPPPLIATLPVINTGIALSVAFDMVTKPASITVGLGVILVGIVVSAFTARRAPRSALRSQRPAFTRT